MQKLSVKPLILLPIIFIFLPAFTFWIPFLNAGYLYFFMFLYIAIGLLFITNYKYCITRLVSVYSLTPLKYFCWFLGLMILNSILLGICGKINILNCIRSIIMQIFLFAFPIIIYFTCTIEKYLSLKRFVKIFISLFWIMLIMGFIAYIGQYFEIELINNIFDFLANARIIRYEKLGRISDATNYVAFGLPRLDNLFEEPSFYARFLFLFLPMVYSFGLTKITIYKNNILNFVIKRTLIPFTWLNIILTLSPIFLLFNVIITLIYFSNELIFLIKKHFIFIISLIIVLFIFLFKIDLSETYLSRILNVLLHVRSFDDFILIEPSLATRICTYVNSFILFLKHPITGVGLGNIQQAIVEQFYNSPINLPPEIIYKIDFAIETNTRYSYNANYIIDLIAINGFFIFSLFVYFYYKLLRSIYCIYTKIIFKNSFDYLLGKTLYYLLITLIIKSCYDSSFIDTDMYLILSVVILYIFVHSKMKGNKNA